MKVAVLCEWSATVRDAFIRRGHDAISCDLDPSASNAGPHIQADCRDRDWSGYDLIIAFPPCTYLCSSGLHRNFDPERAKKTEAALDFVRWIFNLKVPRLCVENPVGVIGSRIKPSTQTIQPWCFGHPEQKTTCLWLKNLPILRATKVLPRQQWKNRTPSGQDNLSPTWDRARIRGKTYLGIAEAMADQWGSLATS
jgi:site-specific DNA-cytosine methylase